MTYQIFLNRFFGAGNSAWPGRDYSNEKTVKFLGPYLALFEENASDVPYILPRNEPGNPLKHVYVIPRASRQANAVREWLMAFVVPSHAVFVDRPESLRAGDAIDDAVAAFIGHRRVYVLEHPQESSRDVWAALGRMCRTVAGRPATHWSETLPVGRLLAEFDLAMAAGDHRSTAELLTRLEGTGLGGMNLAYLAVKRLARIGRHSELLRMPQLRDVVATRPPAPVREAVLDAIHSTLLAGSLADGDLNAARQALVSGGQLVPPLADGPLSDFGVEALTVVALGAAAAGNAILWQRLRVDREAWTRLAHAQIKVIEYVEALDPAFRPPPTAVQAEERAEDPGPGGIAGPERWTDLVGAIAAGRDVRGVMAEEGWRGWEPAAASDEKLANLLYSLDNDGAERAWDIVGAFVESDGFREPASRTARAFLANALSYSRFRFSDMAGIVALLDIALRGGLSASEYSLLLADLGAESARWVSVNYASIVLDMCDVIARAPSPDNDARQRITELLLAPLARQRTRLEQDQLALARIIDDELGLRLPWSLDDEPKRTGLATDSAREILLYSLDEGALRRAGAALRSMAPKLNVQFSSDHVGSSRLRQWVKRADIIIMATRCAKHAATGFIRTEARPDTVIKEADGAGSASLLRAASATLS